MLEVFLASKGCTPVEPLTPLTPNQLITGFSLARSNPKSLKAIDFIATVPSPLDSKPRNVYRVDGAAIHRPMAGLTRFSDEKKEVKAFDKKDHQNYIRGRLELQHHLLRSKTMLFARKNMDLVNEINEQKYFTQAPD
jgi:hypothetical protein